MILVRLIATLVLMLASWLAQRYKKEGLSTMFGMTAGMLLFRMLDDWLEGHFDF